MINKSLYKGKELEIFNSDISSEMELPFYENLIPAGFPSPALDFTKSSIDLNKLIIKNPTSTFYARVIGNSMIGFGIYETTILVIDRSLPSKNEELAVCYLNGDFTVKQLKIEKDVCWLMPANKQYEPIKINKDENNNDLVVWGIVTYWINRSKDVRTHRLQ